MAISTVAVLGGTGQQGRGIALRLARAGHRVIVGSRDAQRAAEVVSTWRAEGGYINTEQYGRATAAADVVVLAVPFGALDPLLTELRSALRPGALVVDVTVPVIFGPAGPALAPVAEGSAAAYVRARLPEHARLAAAFKTIPAHLLNDVATPLDCDEFICGDSAEARSEASLLAASMDRLRPVDVGPLSRARSIEHLTLLAIAINRRNKLHDARFRVVGL
jgi:8-hydroxy-5-deazaflavin:NADPH oxidoreductase